MDSTVRTVLFYQFTNNDNTNGKKKITVASFQVCIGGGYSSCHLNPNSVTLNREAAHFCKMSEQMHYTI